MASSANTWQKKLSAKGRKFVLSQKLGTCKPHSLATSQDVTPEVKRVREFNAPTSVFYVAPRKRRGFNGCRLSHEKRLAVLARHEKRVEFFAELGVRI